jgi:50S ribosomal protein L16 3-hydroxylase
VGEALYRDSGQSAVASSAAIPASLASFARQVLDKALNNQDLLDSLLGEYLTEPKAHVWFDESEVAPDLSSGVSLDRRTKMMYDARHVFINGESFRVGGKDARLLRQLADNRSLSAAFCVKLSESASDALCDWMSASWLKPLKK